MPVIALYIAAAVIGVITILFMCRIYVIFSYCDDCDNCDDGAEGALSVTVRYTFWRMRLVPSPGGKIKLGDYTYEKTHRKKDGKKEKKKPQQKRTKKKDSGKRQAVGEESEAKKKSAISMLIEMREMIFDLLKRVPGKLRLEIKRMNITVGAADAAATAITYGVVTQAVGAVLTLAEEHADIRIKRGCVMITPNFLSGKISADAKAKLSVRIGSIVGLALRFLLNFIKFKMSRRNG